MKIAIPTRADAIDDHFGHCESYSIFTIGNNKNIVGTETLAAPQGCGCKSNIASALQDKHVTVLLASNMGTGAVNVLTKHGIKVYRGCSGNVTELVNDFLDGKVTDSGEGCNHHEEGHQCEHH